MRTKPVVHLLTCTVAAFSIFSGARAEDTYYFFDPDSCSDIFDRSNIDGQIQRAANLARYTKHIIFDTGRDFQISLDPYLGAPTAANPNSAEAVLAGGETTVNNVPFRRIEGVGSYKRGRNLFSNVNTAGNLKIYCNTGHLTQMIQWVYNRAARESYEGTLPLCPDDEWTPGAAVLISHWAGPGKPDYWFFCGWWLNSLKENEEEHGGQPFDTRLTLYKQRQGWGSDPWRTSSSRSSIISAWRANLQEQLHVAPSAGIADVDLLAPAGDLMTLVALTYTYAGGLKTSSIYDKNAVQKPYTYQQALALARISSQVSQGPAYYFVVLACITRQFGIQISRVTGNYVDMGNFDATFDPGGAGLVYRPAIPDYPAGPINPDEIPPPYPGPPVRARESESEVK